MKQTVVDFIELKLLGLVSFDSEELRKKYKDIFKQAKEMGKQQIGYTEEQAPIKQLTNKNMEKEFIPYQEALALKELGFDEECFGAFIGKELKLFNFSNDLKGYVNDNNLIIAAPTFSQAFRWFREKYKLSGLIEIGNQEYSFIIFDEEKDSRKITSSMNGTYEEAELACLKKLIETKNL